MQIDTPEDPRLLRVHAERLIKRDIDQLLGICEFALQDGHIDQGEAKSILDWLNNHRACLDTWPASVLYDRLREMLADDILDAEEQSQLLSLVMSIARPRNQAGRIIPSSLPIDTPPPKIVFASRSFCFTGVFEFGKRIDCRKAVAARGGVPAAKITQTLNYLVIGNIGSEVWKHTSFGNKIAKAVDYRDAGYPLAILSEEHWVKHLK